MNRTMGLLALLATSVAAVACEGDLTVPGQVADLALEGTDTVRIELGQTVSFERLGLAVTYLALDGDSRCPSGVECVWQGDAEVRLRLVTAGVDTEVVLHTGIEPRVTVVGGVQVELLNVLPYPVYQQPTDPEDTVITVRAAAAQP